MGPSAARHDAVLVIRVWREAGHSAGFRARVLGLDSDDPGNAFVSPSTAEVLEAVRGWLAEWDVDDRAR